MWHKVVVVLHVPALLDAHKVLHRVEVLPGARARQELLHGHGVAQEDRHELKQQGGKHTGSFGTYLSAGSKRHWAGLYLGQLTRCADRT